MSICSYSQTSYPKKIVLHGDTCVVILSSQLIKINYKLQYKNYLIEQNRQLQDQVNAITNNSSRKDSIISRQKIIIGDHGEIINAQLADIKSLVNQNKDLNTKLKKYKKTNKFLMIGAGALAFVTLLLVR